MSLCDNIRSAPELRPRIGFQLGYSALACMYTVWDGARLYCRFQARNFHDFSCSHTAQAIRRIGISGDLYVLWIDAPDQSSPVYMSRVPDALWRYTI